MPTDGKLLKALRADVTRLERKVTDLQADVLTQVTRLHGALDESDRLRRELAVASKKCLNWDALQTIVDALKAHMSGT